MESVKCPSCSGIQAVDTTTVAYRCTLCGSDWTWAACLGCARLELALVGQESWKCSRCGRYTRSWWRSTTARAEAIRISQLRVERRAGRINARERAPRRRRRQVAIATLGMAVFAGAAGVTIASASGLSPDDHDRVACVAFTEIRSTTADGAMTGAAIRRSIAAARDEAVQGSPAVAAAAEALAAAGQPGTAKFLVAQTKVVQACG